MKINVTRRDVLKFAAGGAVGVALTPVPWKAVDDLAIWSQNWSWIPVPPKGPSTMRVTACALCPAGCGLKARCIGGLPVAMLPAGDPAGAGALCPLGLTGHHLPYHPARIAGPTRILKYDDGRRRIPVALGTVVAESARAIAAARSGGGSVAVLDMRPGRSSSCAWRRFLAAAPAGIYVPAPGRDGASLTTLAGMIGGDGEIGLDLTNARTVVSFGAPLAEGWGSPRFLRRVLRGEGGELRLIQIEPDRSRTAAAALRWLPARPGTEATLALGLAHVLIAENLVAADAIRRVRDYRQYADLVSRFGPEAVATATGIPAKDIVDTAREMAKCTPTLVVAGEDAGGGRHGVVTETAILGLNLLLGNIGVPGGVAVRPASATPYAPSSLAAIRELDDLADGSVALLVIDASAGDGAVPWPSIARKLVPKRGLVVALSPFFAGTVRNADYVVPTAPFLETILEVPTPFDATRESIALSAALLPPRQQAVDAIAFMRAIADASSVPLRDVPKTAEEVMKARVADIHAGARGTLTSFDDGSVKAVKELASADDLWNGLTAGARWEGDPSAAALPSSWSLMGPAMGPAVDGMARLRADAGTAATLQYPLLLMPHATRDVTASAAVSPVMTKIYQESGLRRRVGTVAINPDTARELGMRSGARVRLETTGGALRVTLNTSHDVMPGVIEASAGPEGSSIGDRRTANDRTVLDIMPAGPAWRVAAARLVEG